MGTADNQPKVAVRDDPAAFEVWLGRTLKVLYEPVLHEPVPDQILAVLSEPARQD